MSLTGTPVLLSHRTPPPSDMRVLTGGVRGSLCVRKSGPGSLTHPPSLWIPTQDPEVGTSPRRRGCVTVLTVVGSSVPDTSPVSPSTPRYTPPQVPRTEFRLTSEVSNTRGSVSSPVRFPPGVQSWSGESPLNPVGLSGYKN